MTAKRILVMDDDLGTREFYRAAFEEAGFAVKAVPDPAVAILHCETFNPDLLLLDWDVPCGGGKRVFEEICVISGKKLPVLFVTGFPGKVEVDILATRVTVLKKPVGVEKLLAHAAYLLE